MLAFAIFLIISSLYGFGQHNADLDKDDVKMATLCELCGQSVIAVGMGLSKCGVALFLSRIANSSTDATADSVMFSSTELALTLICVSLPVFRPLSKRLASTRSSKRPPFDNPSNQGSSRGLGTGSRVWKGSKHRSKSRENEYGMQSIAEARGAGMADQSDEEGSDSAWKDSASDKSILAEEQEGISRKQEFSVSYEQRGQRSGQQ
ncbi:hypothetical protein LQW54_000868 [Pestalotiopsis sp. IQ-011]